MTLRVRTGKGGLTEIMEYNINLSPTARIKYLTSLRNRIWKLLPIYEGKDKSGKVVIQFDKAYDNFYKNLEKLVLEMSGANEIWYDNAEYVELLYLLTGMKTFLAEDHDRIKYIIVHCADLCEKMKQRSDSIG